jgi:uncharacterized protein (TIGR02001 family)
MFHHFAPRTLAPALVILAAGWTAPALAADVEFAVAGVSDYRFRGVSLSDHDPAIQGGVTVSTGPFAFDVWGTNISETAGGADVEVDFMATVGGEVGLTRFSGGVVYYVYPGDSDANYVELLGEVGQDFGVAQLSLLAGFVPSQDSSGNQSNRYFALAGETDAGFATLFGSVGRESGAFAPGGKWDWQIGAKRDVGPVEVSLSYIDTNRAYRNDAGKRLAGPTALLSVGVSF